MQRALSGLLKLKKILLVLLKIEPSWGVVENNDQRTGEQLRLVITFKIMNGRVLLVCKVTEYTKVSTIRCFTTSNNEVCHSLFILIAGKQVLLLNTAKTLVFKNSK